MVLMNDDEICQSPIYLASPPLQLRYPSHPRNLVQCGKTRLTSQRPTHGVVQPCTEVTIMTKHHKQTERWLQEVMEARQSGRQATSQLHQLLEPMGLRISMRRIQLQLQ